MFNVYLIVEEAVVWQPDGHERYIKHYSFSINIKQ